MTKTNHYLLLKVFAALVTLAALTALVMAAAADPAEAAKTKKRVKFAENAGKLDGKDSTEFLSKADSTEFLGKTEKAADSDKLDGKDSTDFLAGRVRTVMNQSAPVAGPAGGNPATVDVSCGAGEKVIGGSGAWVIGPNVGGINPSDTSALEVPITAVQPIPPVAGTDNHTGIRVSGRNLSGVNRTLQAWVFCVSTTP